MATKIKICGLRSRTDIEIINEARPDFAGFVLTPSPRQVSMAALPELTGNLDSSILSVGVFAKESLDEILSFVERGRLRGIQLHTNVTKSFYEELMLSLACHFGKQKPFIWQRFPVWLTAQTPEEIESHIGEDVFFSKTAKILFDTLRDKKDGGSGCRFPWQPAKAVMEKRNIDGMRSVIAGGIDSENAKEAVAAFHPYALDCSGKVETDGVKDKKKILSFVQTVRDYR